MKIIEKLIESYQNNYDSKNMTNAYINAKLYNNLAVWSNDIEFADHVFESTTIKEIMKDVKEETDIIKKASELGLIIIKSENGLVLCIPENAMVKIAMSIEDDINDGYDITRDYISGVTIIKYNNIIYWYESMDDLDEIFYT